MYKIKTFRKKILADTMTPVSIYQKIRDKFSNSILLESSDYGATIIVMHMCVLTQFQHLKIKEIK